MVGGLAATARLLQDGEDKGELQELDARNPEAAMGTYRQLQDDRPHDPFLLRMTAEGLTTFFVSVPDPSSISFAR